MPVTSMKTIPYGNTGMLHGGVREHRAILNNLQADAFRSASQSQDVGQAARAFSGSTVTNNQTQTASLSQTATADNTKTVTIAAVTGTNANAGGFNFNYLQKYIAGADAADFLARGAANIAQDQGSDQSAFAKLNDFSGTDSVAQNSVAQDALVTQRFDVDLSATVSATTNADNSGDAYNQARFRTIEANMQDQSAQAIFTSGQRQGSGDSPLSQVAVADGADSDNTLVQNATITQTGNTVHLTGTFSLDQDESGSVLSPRTTDLLAKLNEAGGTNSAINSSAASQEQLLVQSAAGGVNENGDVTENGGTARNLGQSSASNTETTTVTNTVTITI